MLFLPPLKKPRSSGALSFVDIHEPGWTAPVVAERYDRLISNVVCLIASMRGLSMRFFFRLLSLTFVITSTLTGVAAVAQTTTAASSHGEDEDLRKQVRELALRVSALEAELHRQRTGTPAESASLQPA